MKEMSFEEQLLLLAYAGIPKIKGFLEEHRSDLEAPLVAKTECVFFCTLLASYVEKCKQFPNVKVDGVFLLPDVEKFFDSLVSLGKDDPRDIRLITKLASVFLLFTNSEMQTYADFWPFMTFKHDSWLQLMVRIQKSDSVALELKEVVEVFITKGFSLILNPALSEYREIALTFFSWFEKLNFPRKKELITDAMLLWLSYEEEQCYNLSEKQEEEWYVAALKFSVNISSRDYVSKIFAQSFKNDYFQTYERFRLLVGLDDITLKEDVFTEQDEMFEPRMVYKYTAEELVEIFIKEKQVKELSSIIFWFSTNSSDGGYEHVRKTLVLLVEKYADCALAKELSLLFTQNLEQNIEKGTLDYEQLPPSHLYISNTDWHWLF